MRSPGQERFLPPTIKVEITAFDSPTDGRNAVVTRRMEVGGFGIAAATLGAAAGEPIVVAGAVTTRRRRGAPTSSSPAARSISAPMAADPRR